MKIILTLALLLSSHVAAAQQRQFYDSAGRNAGRAVTDSQGTTTIYDSGGRVIERATKNGNTTTIYDNAGRRIGTSNGASK